MSLVFADGIHQAPLVFSGKDLRQLSRFPVNRYRVFKTLPNGKAEAIPFQIDELNEYGDYVLVSGSKPNLNERDGIFDLRDELAVMGDDFGIVKEPSNWGSIPKPSLLYELKQSFFDQKSKIQRSGAIYVGVYFGAAPPLAQKQYVVFDQANAEVRTSRYRYRFNPKNYLVVNGINLFQGAKESPLIDSSTFYMRANLKYFLTFEAQHTDIQSELEAFTSGPVRIIARVVFFYRFLKVNFELGMFTEVSLFSNGVSLPAIMYNPLNGSQSLNQDSGFYYGFAVHENPKSFTWETNIPQFQANTGIFNQLLSLSKPEAETEKQYWLSMHNNDFLMHMQVTPSKEMLKAGAVPKLYREDNNGEELKKRPSNRALPLGKSPVNLGLYFDLWRLNKGEHSISFKVLFDTLYTQKKMEDFRNLDAWTTSVNRMN